MPIQYRGTVKCPNGNPCEVNSVGCKRCAYFEGSYYIPPFDSGRVACSFESDMADKYKDMAEDSCCSSQGED